MEPSLREDWVDAAYLLAIDDENVDKLQLDINRNKCSETMFKVLTIGQQLFSLPLASDFKQLAEQIYLRYGIEVDADDDFIRFTEAVLFCAAHEDKYAQSVKEMGEEIIGYVYKLVTVYNESKLPDDVDSSSDEREGTPMSRSGDAAEEKKKDVEENLCKHCFIKDATIQSLKAEVADLTERESQNFVRTEALQHAINVELGREVDAKIRLTEKDDSIALLTSELEESAMKILALDLKVYDMEKECAKRAAAVRTSKIQAKEISKLQAQVKNLTEELDIMKPKAEKYSLSENQLENMRSRLADHHATKQELAKVSQLYEELDKASEAQEKEIEILKSMLKEVDQMRDERERLQMENAAYAKTVEENAVALEKMAADNSILQTGEEERLLQIQMLEKELKIAQELLRQSEIGNGGRGLTDLSEEAAIALELERLRLVLEEANQRIKDVEAEKVGIEEDRKRTEAEMDKLQEDMAKLHEDLQDKHMSLLQCDQMIAQLRKECKKSEENLNTHSSEEVEALQRELKEAEDQLGKLNAEMAAMQAKVDAAEAQSVQRQKKLEELTKAMDSESRSNAARSKWNDLLRNLAKNMDLKPKPAKPVCKPNKQMVTIPMEFGTIGSARGVDRSQNEVDVALNGGLDKDPLDFGPRAPKAVAAAAAAAGGAGGGASDAEIEKLREQWAYNSIKMKIELVTKILVIADDFSSEQYGALAEVTKKLESAIAQNAQNSNGGVYAQSVEASAAKRERDASEAKALESITGREEAGNTANGKTKARVLRETQIAAASVALAEQRERLKVAQAAGDTAAEAVAEAAIRQHTQEEIRAYAAGRAYAAEECQALEQAMMFAFETAKELANARRCADVETSVLLGEGGGGSGNSGAGKTHSDAEVQSLQLTLAAVLNSCTAKLEQAQDTQRRYETNLASALEASELRRRAVLSLIQSYEQTTASDTSQQVDTQSFAATVLRQNIAEMIEDGKQTETFVGTSLLDSLEINKLTEALRRMLSQMASENLVRFQMDNGTGPSAEKVKDALNEALKKNEKVSEDLKKKYFEFFEGRIAIEETYRKIVMEGLERTNRQMLAVRAEYNEVVATNKRQEQDLLGSAREVNRLREMLTTNGGSNSELQQQLQQAEEALYESFKTADELRQANERDSEQCKNTMAKVAMEREQELQLLKAKHAREVASSKQEAVQAKTEVWELERQVLAKETGNLKAKLARALKDIEVSKSEISVLKDKIAELKKKMNDPCCECGWNSAGKPTAASMKKKMQDMDSALDDMLRVPRSPPKPSITEQNFLIGAKKDPDQEALEAAILVSMQVEQFGKSMLDLSGDELVVVDQFMDQGFTREEAQLMVFEDVYGKIEGQGEVHQALPSVSKGLGARRQSMAPPPVHVPASHRAQETVPQPPKSPGVVRRRSMLDMSGQVVAAPLPAQPDARRLSGNYNNQSMYPPAGEAAPARGSFSSQFSVADEAEIAVICSKGYTRKDAIQMFLRNKPNHPAAHQQQQQQQQRQSIYNFNPTTAAAASAYITPPHNQGGYSSRGSSVYGGSEVGMKNAAPDRSWVGTGVRGVASKTRTPLTAPAPAPATEPVRLSGPAAGSNSMSGPGSSSGDGLGGRKESMGSQMAQHIHGHDKSAAVSALLGPRSSVRPGHVRSNSNTSNISGLQADYSSPGAAPPPPAAGHNGSAAAKRLERHDSDSSYGSVQQPRNGNHFF